VGASRQGVIFFIKKTLAGPPGLQMDRAMLVVVVIPALVLGGLVALAVAAEANAAWGGGLAVQGASDESPGPAATSANFIRVFHGWPFG